MPEISQTRIAPAVAALKRGEVIVYPTETLYGLGADALDVAAVEKVFRLKGRNPDNPIPVLVADREMLTDAGRRGSSARGKVDSEFLARPFDFGITGAKRCFPTAFEFLRRYRRAYFQ